MSVLSTVGISKNVIREDNDFYATNPKAMEKLLEFETFNENIWECACGEGNLSKVLKDYGYEVFSTDLIDRGYQDKQIDFLKDDFRFNGDIITNPPYKYVNEFIIKALASIPEGNKVVMYLKINHLAGIKRFKEVYKNYPPIRVYIFSKRMSCAKNNNPELFKGGAIDYIWCVWEKGKYGPTYLKWIE